MRDSLLMASISMRKPLGEIIGYKTVSIFGNFYSCEELKNWATMQYGLICGESSVFEAGECIIVVFASLDNTRNKYPRFVGELSSFCSLSVERIHEQVFKENSVDISELVDFPGEDNGREEDESNNEEQGE